MVERMTRSTFSSDNVFEVVDDNINRYKSMVMNAMRMNEGYIGECSIIDEELNVDKARFFELLKDYDKPL